MRDGSLFRVCGPGAGGRVTAGAVYADVARLVAGERPILFGPLKDPLSGKAIHDTDGRPSASPARVAWSAASSARSWPMRACRPTASAPSATRRATRSPSAASVPVHVLDDAARAELDVLFLAVDGPQSREIMAGPGASVPLVVDNSSAFRLADGVPLVVPEANAHAARERAGNLIANPNCTTAAAVVALAPIRDLAGLESVDLASYQAVAAPVARASTPSRPSAAPTIATAAEGSPFHGRIADSVVPQIDVLDETGWTGEEKKIHAEIRKILEMPDLDVAATTVRVPVHTGHSVALHVRTARDTTVASSKPRCATRRASNTGRPMAPSAIRCRSTSRAATPSSSGACAPSRAASAASPCGSAATTCAREPL